MSQTDPFVERTVRAGTERTRSRYHTGLHVGFVATLLVVFVVYAKTYASLIDTWARTGTFQYAFLIFPICAVLIWGRRDWLSRVEARPAPAALLLALVLTLGWLVAAIEQINLGQHIAIVAIVPVLIYAFYGKPVARVLAFAMAYMVFAIPVGDFLVGPLQTITAHFAVGALRLTDMPVLMSGHIISTPAANWHVAQACSGIKFLFASTAFGVLYAHLFYNTLRRRLVFAVCAVVVPVIANGLRVYFTILIGETFGLKYATGTDHEIFGWQFFGTVLIVLFLCGWPFQEASPDAPGWLADRSGPSPAGKMIVKTSVLALAAVVLGPVLFLVWQST